MLFNHFRHLAHFQNARRHVAQLYIFLIFMSVFGIWSIFKMHIRHAARYTFSCFHKRFWHLAHFGNTQRHVAQLYFSHFHEHFFAFIGFKSFLAFCLFLKCTKACDPVIHFSRFLNVFGILPIFEMHRGMWSGHIFSRFMRNFKKVI